MIVNSENRLEFLRKHVITRDDVFAIQTKDGIYRKVGKKLTDAALTRHLDHKITVGCYNSSREGTCKFALVDVDSHEGNFTLPLKTVQQRALKCILTLREFDIPFTFAESSPGCYHIAVYFDPPAKTAEAYDFIRWITRNAQLPDIEVFPKQREVPEGDYGNLIRAPFSLHQKKKTSYHYINTDFNHKDEFELKTIDISGFIPPHDRMKPSTEALTSDETIDDVFNRIFDTPKRIGNPVPGGIPPCLSSALENDAQLIGGGGHYMRIAIVCAYRDVGLPFDALCRLFTGQDDYDQVKTADQVNSVLKKEGGYSYSCRSLREKCSRFVDCQNCPRGKRFK